MPNYKTTLWSDLTLPTFGPLEDDLRVEVAVVGGGITGLTAAHLLTRAGVRVALLESRRVGSGETKKTTAHLTEILDTRLRRLVSSFGEEGAELAVRGHRAAIERIATLVAELGVDCQLQRLPGYLYADSTAEADELALEAETARALGLSAELVTESPLPFPIKRALRIEDQAQLHPALSIGSD